MRHGGGQDSRFDDRVAWHETHNTITKDPEKALRVMAFSYYHADDLKREAGIATTGRKPNNKPGLSLTLSWHPRHHPNQQEMSQAALGLLKHLGLQDHETVLVAHNDRNHAHVHVLTSLVHPVTGLRNRLPYSKLRVSAYLLDYQKERGLEMETPQRVKNSKSKEDLELARKGINAAWDKSSNIVEFRMALKNHEMSLVKTKEDAGPEHVYARNTKDQLFSLSRALELPQEQVNEKFKGYYMRFIPTHDQLKDREERKQAREQGKQRTAPTSQKTTKEKTPPAITDGLNRASGLAQEELQKATDRRGTDRVAEDTFVRHYNQSRDYDEEMGWKKYDLLQNQFAKMEERREHYSNKLRDLKELYETNHKLPEKREDIIELRKQVTAPRGLLEQFSDKRAQLQDRLDLREMKYNMILQQYKESIREVKDQKTKEFADMKSNHKKEFDTLEKRIVQDRPSWYVNEMTNAELKKRGMYQQVMRHEEKRVDQVKDRYIQKAKEEPKRENKQHELSNGRQR